MGVWLAVSEATLDNGCLHVLPGSHTEPVHTHVPDRREGANYGYVEIVDHDMAASVPVLMAPGDVLVFDSHLMHRSTDNLSSDRQGRDGVPPRRRGHDRPHGRAAGLHGQRLDPGPPVRCHRGGDMSAEARPTIAEIVVGDEPDSWRAGGFTVDDDGICRVGSVRIALVGREQGKRILSWSLRDVADRAPSMPGTVDGLVTDPDERPAGVAGDASERRHVDRPHRVGDG